MTPQTPTILVIDDDPADQFLVQEAMKVANLNYNLRLVSDGDEALDYLFGRGRYGDRFRAPRPDLILLDLNMPRLSGRQVARAIKGTPQLRKIPIVILTTSGQEEDVEELYGIGVNSYMQKPANFDEFTAALRDLSNYWLERAALPAGRA
ncbi:MAG TPA: response regulator [Bryobacterales bacterium]|nr:response regulator [Bryobacterales bacterium]